MLNFGMLPPEVNSTRMYAGPGSGPMMAAAAAWDALTWQLDSFAVGCSSVISELQEGVWSGGASQAMVAAAKPFIAWATATATQTEQVAGQARAAAAAYEAAFAATVPPAVVAANRIQLATLVATNFFGQNTALIAATEAAYAEMWAQDATAMYGYAAAASAAAQLTPFQEPPPTTNAAAQPAQVAAQAQSAGSTLTGNSQATLSQLMSAVPQQLNALATAESPGSLASPILTGVDGFNTLTRPLVLAAQAWRTVGNAGNYIFALLDSPGGSAAKAATTAHAVEPAAAGARGAVLASMGEAAPVGTLSAPASWPTSAPAAGPVAAAPQLPAAPYRDPAQAMSRPAARVRGTAPPAGFGPMQGLAPRRTGYSVFRMRDRRYRMPRPAFGG